MNVKRLLRNAEFTTVAPVIKEGGITGGRAAPKKAANTAILINLHNRQKDTRPRAKTVARRHEAACENNTRPLTGCLKTV